MNEELPDPKRREFLSRVLIGGLVGIGMPAMPGIPGIPGLIRRAFAMGSKEYPQGMRNIRGLVRINETAAQVGAIVKAGDIVSTGADSMAIFVIGKDAYMLRDNSRLELGSESADKIRENIIEVLRLANGKMMGVFAKSRKRIELPTAVVGIRGTGCYAESDPERSYFCLCYGTAELRARENSDAQETIRSHHHDSPRYIHASGKPDKLIEKIVGHGEKPNHTDEELIMLESFVGRRPPFVVWEKDRGGY